MEINFDCKLGEFINQLPKRMYCDVLAMVLLNIQEHSKPFTDCLPINMVIKLYSKQLSDILEADCKEVFSEKTMELLNKELNNGFN